MFFLVFLGFRKGFYKEILKMLKMIIVSLVTLLQFLPSAFAYVSEFEGICSYEGMGPKYCIYNSEGADTVQSWGYPYYNYDVGDSFVDLLYGTEMCTPAQAAVCNSTAQ
jgi:hypothetical protein